MRHGPDGNGDQIYPGRQGAVQGCLYFYLPGRSLIKGMHISPYKQGNIFNVDETRDRKLLMHKYEIQKLFMSIKTDGYTLIPTKMYLKNGKAKLEIALAKGKNLYDKREDSKLRDARREMEKALKFHG